MSKKSHCADSFLTYVLLVVAVTLTVTGVVSVDAMQSYDVAVSTIHPPKQEYRYLFNIEEYRKLRRELNETRNGDLTRSASSVTSDESSSSASSEEAVSSSSSVSSSAARIKPYTFGDLTYSQRRTLLLQLRKHVCPSPNKNDTIDSIRYQKLCVMELRKQNLEVREGAKNPDQE